MMPLKIMAGIVIGSMCEHLYEEGFPIEEIEKRINPDDLQMVENMLVAHYDSIDAEASLFPVMQELIDFIKKEEAQ